ncbi:TPA: thioredoxin family protein [Candidatus Avigastranaerophilus faecigallinarum]|nr:thioredoxin family protein [Candidatus Avigastranaerophilus faecigallinarum]
MKNIITILLILIVPVAVYLYLSKNSDTTSAVAKDKTKPSIMIFTSAMCLDCQKMKSVINEVQPIYSDKINFISINALDKSKKVQDYIKKYGIVLVPTIIFVDENENQKNKVEGYIPKEELITEIEDIING